MIKHLVFDFGGVILNLNGVHTGYPNNLSDIFNLPLSETKKIWKENKDSIIMGKESPKDFLNRMRIDLGSELDIEQAIIDWEKKNTITKDQIDWALLEILGKLKGKYKIHMLTDQIELDNDVSLWIEGVNKNFDTILRSYEQGLKKPFPEAYHNLLQKIGATEEPESVIFVDYFIDNVGVANEMSINGFLYEFGVHGGLLDFFGQFDIAV